MDTIRIEDLEVHARVGVTDEERSRAQRLLVTVDLTVDLRRAGKTDHLGDTVDYAAVVARLTEAAASRSWNLIEAMATDLAELLLREVDIRCVSIEIRKFILPNTRSVSVKLVRHA